MKYIFIINTIAGKGKYKKILPNIETVCKQRNIEYEIRYITKEKDGTEIARENLMPGDLILFYDEGKTKIGHTGIYISNGDFIHAANPTRGVVTDNLNTNSYYNTRFITARRIVE